MACRAHLGEVQGHYEQIEHLGGTVVAVCSTRPDQLRPFLARHPFPFLVAADPAREAYRALGLGRTSWGAFLKPAVVWSYLRQLLRGWRPTKPAEGDDLLQLGGDFVFDGELRLVYAYRSKDATDRPRPEAIVQAVRAASQ